jgi:hypothetical protein
MKTHSGSLFSWGILLTVMLILGQVGAQVHAEGSDPVSEPTETPQVSLSSPAPQNQPGAASWYDGIPQYSYVQDFWGNWIQGFGTYVGYFQDAENGQPSVGSIYYLHLVVYGMGIPFGSSIYAYISFQLPPNTALALSESTPLYCFGGEPPDVTSFACPQSLPLVTSGPYPGTYLIRSYDDEFDPMWPVPAGWFWEFQIPVITSTTLDNSAFIGVIDNIEASNQPDWLFPTVPIYVWPVQAPGAFDKASPANGATGLSTSPTLSWGTSSGATSYSYCYDTTDDDACTNWVDNGPATSKTLSGLATNTTYYWHVRAANSGGTTYSNASSTAFWSFKTAAATSSPGAFDKASPTNGATGLSTSPTLSWGTSSGATSYSYCYDTTDDNACTNWVDNGPATSKTLSELATNTTYYWHVRAANSGGTTYSNASSTAFWSFKTAAATSAPGAFDKASPENGATGLSTGPTLSWGTSSGATSYSYCYDTTDDNACTNWVDNGLATSKTLSGLAANSTYYWHVRAANNVGTAYSNTSSTAFWSFKTAAPGESKKVYLPLTLR